MRLINTETLELQEFFESQAPPYAILSHTWEKDEVSFQDMLSKSPSTLEKAGYKKIQDTCKMAQTRGQQWVWVDTCCIDKSSSADLTESINSMYRWYQKAAECYAYLVDFNPGSLLEEELEKCRWFTRGWTLQELIAPRTVLFYDRDWNLLGRKSDKHILEVINRITHVSEHILLHRRPLGDFAIAERMLWASARETTRPEDKAYCLLGIFEVNMPLIYGEGDNAFRRLQEEIIKRSNDLSIFLWGTPLDFHQADRQKRSAEHPSCNLFATSPADFKGVWQHMSMVYKGTGASYQVPEFALTNKGLNIGAHIGLLETREGSSNGQHTKIYYTIYVAWWRGAELAVSVDKVGPGLYARLGLCIIHPHTDTCYVGRDRKILLPLSTVNHTILVDHRTLSTAKEELFHESVSIRWSSDLDIEISGTLPHAYWDASRQLFFAPELAIYGEQTFDVACATLSYRFVPESYIYNLMDLYLIIDFAPLVRSKNPRAFVMGEDDVPEIANWQYQGHIPHHILFPMGDVDPSSRHLLNKGREFGLQKKGIPSGYGEDPPRVTLSVEIAPTSPRAELDTALGRTTPGAHYTVMLHATLEEYGSAGGNDASPTHLDTAGMEL